MIELGKINQKDFEEIFAGKFGYDRSEVSTGPSFGVDVSVVDLPNNFAMALTSDPLSLIPSLGLEESCQRDDGSSSHRVGCGYGGRGAAHCTIFPV